MENIFETTQQTGDSPIIPLRRSPSLWLRLRLRRDAIFHHEHDVFKLAAAAAAAAALGHTYYLNYGLAIHFLGRGRARQGPEEGKGARRISQSSIYFLSDHRCRMQSFLALRDSPILPLRRPTFTKFRYAPARHMRG